MAVTGAPSYSWRRRQALPGKEETSPGPGERGSLRDQGALSSGRTAAVRKEMLGPPAHEGTTDLPGRNSL